ncbi:hypothetical protein [Leifsonia sp. Root112D2]|uniref:hypothetical protein n=1 Tax=Leifsonia sp. Root112D2 TaxID=1736426 RepID=UPI0006F99A1F|nr:hypothetical protein [Leifsonia sp. Root112D2]KQV05031.1 hypothetical protein ASC63_14535 [Leifsonia sp. Root112D2]
MSRRTKADHDLATRPWGGAVRDYDLFKELTIGVVVVGLIVIGFAAVASSPDEPTVNLQSWAKAAPNDFVATATAELGGTSDTASYGPPYSTTQGATQTLGPIDLQSLSGTRLPIDTAREFVTLPLQKLRLATAALSRWQASTPAQQDKWTAAYVAALAKAPGGSPAKVAGGAYGPVPSLTEGLLTAANRGALDGVIQDEGGIFNTNTTPTILFLGDGTYFPNLAAAQHLTGDQWGMMNETGNYPGQSWLWLFSFWYQVPAIGNLGNADLVVVGLMLVLSALLTLVPFIPGLRSIPRLIPLHRLIWRDYYRNR